jgi:hypothetical protein
MRGEPWRRGLVGPPASRTRAVTASDVPSEPWIAISSGGPCPLRAATPVLAPGDPLT